VRSSAVWLAGENAIRNSGKAIKSAFLSFALWIQSTAFLRFASLLVDDSICAMAILLMAVKLSWPTFYSLMTGIIPSVKLSKDVRLVNGKGENSSF
jgi:hypothetical protein